MLSFELLEAIQKLRDTVRAETYLFQVLVELAEDREDLINRLRNMLSQTSQETAWNAMQSVLERIRAIENKARAVRHKHLFSQLIQTEEAISTFSKVTGVEPFSISILTSVDDFSFAYERLVSSYSFADGLTFAISSQQLYQVLHSTMAMLDTVSQGLESEERSAREGESELLIVLHPKMEISNVAMKLNALAEIYSESCRLLDVSYTEYPLRIVKMEAGSLWLKLFGENRVVTFLFSLIDRGISYFHRNYTREGKIEGIPKKIEVIDEVLGLTSRLAAEGIDTSQMKESINKASIGISDELNRLLRGEAVIRINEKTYSVGSEFEKKYIEESRQLLLDSDYEGEKAPTKRFDPGNEVEE